LWELARAGAAIIELGVPFSDPMADGPVIQRASERALGHGFGLAEILETVSGARKETDVPIVLFSYFNPLLQFGIEKLADQAKQTGVDVCACHRPRSPKRLLTSRRCFHTLDLDMIFLVAPTSTDKRLQLVAERASGFIYAVSRAGITGAREDISARSREVSRAGQTLYGFAGGGRFRNFHA
jgi:tryptophan synthase alpha chain